MTHAPPETAGVVARLGVRVHGDAAALLQIALRRNPRRAQLLVSRVLGKHVPTDPRLVRGAGLLLGGLVADALAGAPARTLPVALLHRAIDGDGAAAASLHTEAQPGRDRADAMVLGFAETATALGHCVAEGLGGADYLHSTRRAVAGSTAAGGFTEEHSHATEHLLLPRDPALLRGPRPLVLVDDELSTGRTVLNTITALHRTSPREHYVVAALTDVRGDDRTLTDGAHTLGVRLDVVALARGTVELPPDLRERAESLRVELDAGSAAADRRAHPDSRAPTPRLAHAHGPTRARSRPDSRVVWRAGGSPAGGRHGFTTANHVALAAAVAGLAAELDVRPGERTLVLGTEELMALPLRLAQTLADSGADVAFSTTTRSPAVVVDEPGYGLRTGITFPAHDEPAGVDPSGGPRFAYNLGGPGSWDHVVVVVDPPTDTPALYDGLLAALVPLAHRTTVVVTP